MSKKQRKFERAEINIEVSLCYLQDDIRIVTTQDVSQGGLFMLLDNPDHYLLGEMVNLKYDNPLSDDHDSTENDAIIVRCTEKGIAVAFVEMEEF
ncbi:MAG TPA: PilZ domain-containing protein [Gammaproteobacteria bacterium]|nr:PilZ domain-containing protein [Gammaproteobacteria bacterium]